MARQRFLTALVAALALLAPAAAAEDSSSRDILFQTSTLDALMAGLYDGNLTFQELRQHGDFGIGTFHALDGEMIALDGSFYQVSADGAVHPAADTMKTPFATVTFFDRDRSAAIDGELDCAKLQEKLDEMLDSRNIPQAIRIDGEFAYVKTRSVPRQEKPYPKLVEVIATQPTFEFRDVKGTFAGFRCPSYLKGINFPGYHFHFLNAQRTGGGHVLECRVRHVNVAIDSTAGFRLSLPESGEFPKADLEGGRAGETEKAEKGK